MHVSRPEANEADLIRPGMSIEMRQRKWRVEDFSGGVITARPIDDLGASPQRFLVDLEHPSPARTAEPALRELGDFSLQQLLLQAIRLDALHGTAPFLALQRLAVIPVEYQLVPLVMACRQDPVRLLIADTVGVGKTIEAGLVASELFARARARSLLVVTPAGLRQQWQQQLRDLFYIDCEIMSTENRRRLERAIPPGADPWTYFDRLIVSIDYMKDSLILPEVLKRDPPWDIVIVDEAHNCAMPHSQQGRRADMERWAAVSKLAARCRHLLLLTATPHNGYTDSYSSLLHMLSPECTEGSGTECRPRRQRASYHVCQRTRRDIKEWSAGKGIPCPFPDREDPTAIEVSVELHRSYSHLLRKMGEQMRHVVSLAQTQAAQWLELHLHRRALSSQAALMNSLRNRIQRIDAQTESTDSSAERGADALQMSLLDSGPSDIGTEDDVDRGADRVELGVDRRIEKGYLEGLLKAAKAITAEKDAKLIRLRDHVLPELLENTAPQVPARVIVFTRYKDTLDYLQRELDRRKGYPVFTLYGDLSDAWRKEVLEEFGKAEPAVLIATDVISEGLNLQSIACKVVHYDLPWNPNRLDQREGRVDRFGQRAPMVYCRMFVCKGTSDEDVMDLYMRKYMRMRADQGFSPPFRASEDTVLRLLAKRRHSSTRSGGQETLFDLDTETDLLDDERNRRALSEGFYGQTHIKFSDVSRRLHEAHRRVGDPSRISRFIVEGLRRNNCSVQEDHGLYKIDLANPRLHVPGVPTVLHRAILDPKLGEIHPDAEVLDVGHPLIRRLNVVIREQALRDTSEGGRAAAFVAKGATETKLIAHALLRAMARTRPPSLLEEVVVFGLGSGLHGVSVLTRDEAEDAMNSPPMSIAINRESALQRMVHLRDDPAWDLARQQAIDGALQELVQYRRAFAEEVSASGESEWLQGYDEVELVDFDLYCLTLILPEPR